MNPRPTPVATLPCLHCGDPLEYRRKRADEFQGAGQGDTSLAWRHASDGSIYAQREDQCRACRGRGLTGPRNQTPCRPCGARGIVTVDDHCALPDRSGR